MLVLNNKCVSLFLLSTPPHCCAAIHSIVSFGAFGLWWFIDLLFHFFLFAFYHESCAYVNPVDANTCLSILMLCPGRNKQQQNLENKSSWAKRLVLTTCSRVTGREKQEFTSPASYHQRQSTWSRTLPYTAKHLVKNTAKHLVKHNALHCKAIGQEHCKALGQEHCIPLQSTWSKTLHYTAKHLVKNTALHYKALYQEHQMTS